MVEGAEVQGRGHIGYVDGRAAGVSWALQSRPVSRRRVVWAVRARTTRSRTWADVSPAAA